MGKSIIVVMVCLFTLAAEKCTAQVLSRNYCNVVETKTITVDIAPFGERAWYEYGRANGLLNPGTKCNAYNFAPTVPDKEFALTVTGKSSNSGNPATATALVRILGSVEDSVLTGSLRITVTNPLIGNRRSMIYSVIGRDLEAQQEWLVLYACDDFFIGRIEDVIILVASRSPSQAVKAAAFESAISTGILPSEIKLTEQTGCD